MSTVTMRILVAALALTVLTAGAHAQGVGGVGGADATGGGFGGSHGHRQGKTDKTVTPKPKVDEKAYDAALKKLPDKQYDAWRNVR
jgi:hypothetical protein